MADTIRYATTVTSIGPLLLAGAVADVLGVAKAFTLLGLGLFALTAASIRASPRAGMSASLGSQ